MATEHETTHASPTDPYEGSVAHGAHDAHGHGAHGSPGIDTLFYPAINFVIYMVAMFIIYKKLGAPALVKRHQLVKSELDRASIDLNQAERELETITQRLNTVDAMRSEIAAQYDAEGKRMSESIIRAAREQAERAAVDARRQMESEISQAKKQLQRESVRLASDLARKKLSNELLAEEDKRLRKGVVEQIARSNSAQIAGTQGGAR